ncbi:MAG TPA: NAD(P)-dependent oxidoreductase [Polyangiaceae bacterium]|nr:NAD(P)-dependent oxidoreductase [Polyangiaceae bacterium]
MAEHATGGSAGATSGEERVGVIGLGIIGSVWAANYATDGLLSASWNRSRKPEVPQGVDDAAAVARASSVVHVVVSDPAAVEQVLASIEPELGRRHLVIQSTTIDPKSAERFAARVKTTGASYVEAPFMGSRPAAEQRKTVFLEGGDAAAVARADGVLSHLSSSRRAVGSEAQAAALKLSFNVHVAITMQGICEGLNFARQAGLKDDDFFQVLSATALWSPFHSLKEPKLRAGEFAPQFSVKHMLKDVRLASELAREGSLPLGKAVRQQLVRAAEAGFSEEDMASLIKVL